MTGISLYEPSELVVRALSGTPVEEVQALLASHGQELPFEPPSFDGLYDGRSGSTIGALAAMNLSGPRRISSGAARDCLLGVRFVNGRGEIVKTGGRVMKNVTGLDLVKLMAGSWGTLGFITEVTFKVLPRPKATATIRLEGLSDREGIDVLTSAMGSPYDVSAAAHVPSSSRGTSETLIRVEGSAASVEARAERLRKVLAGFGGSSVVDSDASMSIWTSIRELGPLNLRPEDVVWRISLPPDRAVEVSEVANVDKLTGARWFYDWSGGLLWLALPMRPDASAGPIRSAVDTVGGHATLIKAPEDLRRRVSVFHPLSVPVANISCNIKKAFDPYNIFNPFKMYDRI
jgi:glycolate oxidase FAD binding subunit